MTPLDDTSCGRHLLARSRRVLFLVGALLVSSVPAAAQSLLVNGSFEAGPDPGEQMQLPMGSTAVTGWVVNLNPVDYVGTYWAAAEGTRSMALNGANPGGVSQTFATSIGTEYVVRFSMAGDAFSNPILKHMRVSAAGQSQDFEFNAEHSWPWELGWLTKEFPFTANATSTTVQFTSLDAGNTGPTLDDVAVVEQTVGVPRTGAAAFELGSPYPNPSPGGFSIGYALPFEAPIRISILDLAGREVRVLAEGPQSAGRRTLFWDGNTAEGAAPAGLYFVRLTGPGVSLVRKGALSR
jgi:choice-of-anchor C domain-containing protein